MKLGILVNSDKHRDDVIGLTQAALAKGHEVTLFTMDSGTRLLTDPSYNELCRRPGVVMSFCDHSAKQGGVAAGNIPDAIVRGSQYDNAVMMHTADKVIVL